MWHHRLGHVSEKGMKAMLFKGKLPGLNSIDLDFCEDYICGKQRKVSFSKVKKSLKAERWSWYILMYGVMLAQRLFTLVLMMTNL